MDADLLESWLKKRPRPQVLRIVSEGQTEPREIKLKPGANWRNTVESVIALAPESIEALTNDGQLLRAVQTERLPEQQQENGTTKAPKLAAPTVVANDPETARFVLVAQLIAQAYAHSNDVAFTRMVDLFQAVNDRQAILERSLEHMTKLVRKSAEQQLANIGEADATDQNEMLQAFLGGMLRGQGNGEVQ